MRLKSACLLLMTIGLATAQTPAVGYGVSNYYKVPADKRAAFLEYMQLLKSIQQQRVNSGEARAYTVYAVQGAGSAGEYNYVTTLSSDKPLEAVTQENWQAWVKQAGVNWSSASMAMWNPMLVRGVTSRTEVRAGTPLAKGEYVAVRRYRVSPGKQLSALLSAHREDSLPVMNELIAQGKTKSYLVSVPVFTGASALPFDYTVSNGFGSQKAAVENYGGDNWRAAWGKTRPGKNADDFARMLQESRRQVRAELWRVVDRTDPR